MVETSITMAPMSLQMDNGTNLKSTEDQGSEQSSWITKSSHDHPINFDLVSDVRERVRSMLENSDSLDGRYSKQYYDEIMNQEPPYTCWRFIVHCSNNPDSAVSTIKEALLFHHKNQLDDLDPSKFAKEFWHLTPIVKCGRDKAGNQVLYIVGKQYRKPDSRIKDLVRRFTLLVLFQWDRQNRDSMAQITLIFDSSDTGFQNVDLDFMAWLISVRDFLPLRLGNVYVLGIPLLLRPLIRLIIGWLPEYYRKAVRCGSYDELVRPNIDESELPTEVGGTFTGRHRLAPPEAKWMLELEEFSDKKFIDMLDWAIGYGKSPELREERRRLQIEYEEELKRDKIN